MLRAVGAADDGACIDMGIGAAAGATAEAGCATGASGVATAPAGGAGVASDAGAAATTLPPLNTAISVYAPTMLPGT